MQGKLTQSEKWMSEDGVGTYNNRDFQRYKSSVKCTEKKNIKGLLSLEQPELSGCLVSKVDKF